MKKFIKKFVNVSKDVIKFTARTIELVIAGGIIIAILPIAIISLPVMTMLDCISEGGSLKDKFDEGFEELFGSIFNI